MNTELTARPDPQSVAELVQKLCGDYGERAVTSQSVREHHSHGEGLADSALPDVVVFPHSNDEVAAIVRLCHLARVPVIAFGVGTSLEGHVAALYGGVCMDLSQMNGVLEVNAQDLDCRVQAGVTREQLNAELKGTGLFFPIDPGADATIGGMAATRASGTNAVRYGTMRENVLSLKVVLPDGRIIQTSRRAKKSAAGYDLTRLFVGSEGTLGIITEVTLRLYPVQDSMSAAVCAFPTIDGATRTVIQTLQMGVPVARSELLCATTMAALNRHNKLSYRESPTLFLEFHGTQASVVEQAEQVQEVARDNGGLDFQWATRPEERSKIWEARHNAYFACLQLKPGSRAVSTDVCVPISRLAECITETAKEIERASMPIPLFGHVGDGNFHLVILVDPGSRAEMDEAKALNARLVKRALAMEGTCTGEHGIGMGKQGSLQAELGEDVIGLMRDIKKVFDPHNLMNPGKVVTL